MGRKGTIAVALSKSLLKSLVLAGALAGISALVWQVSPVWASLILLVGSFVPMLRSYRREWPLRWLTCLLPMASAITCYVVQVALLRVRPAAEVFSACVAVGLLLGWLSGRSHRIWVRGNQVYAKRTALYLAIWLICFVMTQSFGLFGTRALVEIGLSGGAFSTAMVATVSLMLFRRYLIERSAIPAPRPAAAVGAGAARTLVMLLAIGASLACMAQAHAQAPEPSPAGPGAPAAQPDEIVTYRGKLNPEIVDLIRQALEAVAKGFNNTVVSFDSTSDEMVMVVNVTRGAAQVKEPVKWTIAQESQSTGTPAKITRNTNYHTMTFTDGTVDAQGWITGTLYVSGYYIQDGNRKDDKPSDAPWLAIPSGQTYRVYAGDAKQRAAITEAARDRRVPDFPCFFKLERVEPEPQPKPRTRTGAGHTGSDNRASGQENGGSDDNGASGTGWTEKTLADRIKQFLDLFAGHGDRADAATEAGVVAGLLLLLAGASVNAAMSVANAMAGLMQAQSQDGFGMTGPDGDSGPPPPPPPLPSQAPPPMIDPRTGQPFVTDGDKVWWGGSKDGWIDRDTARQYSDDVLRERAGRDGEVDANWNQWMGQNDARYAQRDRDLAGAGNYYNPDAQAYLPAGYAYDPAHNMVVPPDGQWDPQQGRYVTPNDIGGTPVSPDLQNAYNLQDYIDNNLDGLPPAFQQHVRDQLGGLDLSDPYNISPQDYDRLYRTARSVDAIRTGQGESAAAAADNLDIDRAETDAFIKNFGYGLARFAISRIDPTQGILTGAAFGYFTAPEGSGIKHALIGGAAGYLGSVTGAMNTGNVTWHMATGAAIGGGEQALYGGSWEDIGRGALLGGAMDGLSALGQKPSVRTWMENANDRIGGRLGIPGYPGAPTGLPVIHDRPAAATDPRFVTGVHDPIPAPRAQAPGAPDERFTTGAHEPVSPAGAQGNGAGRGSPLGASSAAQQNGAERQAGALGDAAAPRTPSGRPTGGEVEPGAPPRSGGVDDGRVELAPGQKGQAMKHDQGGHSPEESGRDYQDEIWVLTKDGRRQLPPTGGIEYKPKPGEILITRDKFTGAISDQTRGPGVTDGMHANILDRQVSKLPPVERPASRPDRPAGTDKDGAFHPDEDMGLDEGLFGRLVTPEQHRAASAGAAGPASPAALTPSEAPAGRPGASVPSAQAAAVGPGGTTITGPARPPSPGAQAPQPPGGGSGGELPGGTMTNMPMPPVHAEYDPVAKFQAETGVKVVSHSGDQVTLSPTGLEMYARNKYPDLPPEQGVQQAQQDLTARFQYHQDEAKFSVLPSDYQPGKPLVYDHGLNNSIRDEYLGWVTEKHPLADRPPGGDEGFVSYPARSDTRPPDVVRADIDAATGGKLSRDLPAAEGALDWDHPNDPTEVLPRKRTDFNDYDANHSIEQPSNPRFDDPDHPGPVFQSILDQHPELKGIHKDMVNAYNNSEGAFNQGGKPGWPRFQEEVAKTVDLSDPRTKELVARWTWWVMDRETGAPPWFRAGT